MRRLLALAAALAIAGCGGALAQTVSTPGMGATSPLGSMNFNAPSGPVGIPLGSTELDTAGTSPLPGAAQCPGGAISGIGAAGSSGVFDGGGSSTGSGSSCAATGAAASGAIVNTPAAGIGTFGSTNSSTIPLGSVELANPGVSPLVGVPAPGVATTPCGPTSSVGGAVGAGGTTSGFGC